MSSEHQPGKNLKPPPVLLRRARAVGKLRLQNPTWRLLLILIPVPVFSQQMQVAPMLTLLSMAKAPAIPAKSRSSGGSLRRSGIQELRRSEMNLCWHRVYGSGQTATRRQSRISSSSASQPADPIALLKTAAAKVIEAINDSPCESHCLPRLAIQCLAKLA